MLTADESSSQTIHVERPWRGLVTASKGPGHMWTDREGSRESHMEEPGLQLVTAQGVSVAERLMSSSTREHRAPALARDCGVLGPGQ